jgi:hypothetical protein
MIPFSGRILLTNKTRRPNVTKSAAGLGMVSKARFGANWGSVSVSVSVSGRQVFETGMRG